MEKFEGLERIIRIREILAEFEHLVRTSPPGRIFGPETLDTSDTVDLTPKPYAEFRRSGFDGSHAIRRYERLLPFFQFASAELSTSVSLRSFELSDLHKSGSEVAYGLRAEPIDAAPQGWFTYEFPLDILEFHNFIWLDITLKLSADDRAQYFCQFIIEGDSFIERCDASHGELNEFASFYSNRIHVARIAELSNGRRVSGVRLIFSIGRIPLPISIYSVMVTGKLSLSESNAVG